MRRLTAALVIILTLGLFIIGCDSGVTGTDRQPEPSVKTAQQEAMTNSHGATSPVEATATYRTVDTEAAVKNGFSEVGKKIGTLSVTDDGSALSVTGEASGLDPKGVHVSLFYDKASSAQGNPSSNNANIGASACEPGVTNPDHPLFLTIEQMEIGSGGSLDVWDVKSNGEATLGPTSTLEYVPVKKIGTVSIRDGRVNEGFGPEAVVACGVVTHAAEGPPS